MPLDAASVRAAIEKAVRIEAEVPETVARDIAFHMTDWLDDLGEYYAFCQAPEKLSTQAAAKVLTDFLVHVPNHIAAASKLLTGMPVTDIFSVGATSEEA